MNTDRPATSSLAPPSGAMPAGAVVAPSAFPQRRLWLLDQLYGQQAAYNVPCTYRVSGPLDAGRLQHALDIIVSRHEALRTCLRMVEDDVVQVVLPAAAVPIVERDLGGLDREQRLAAALHEAALDAARPFDLATAPLVRALLFRLAEQDHVFALCVHHVVFDGWSEGVLLDELAAFYDAAGGEPCPIPPPLPLQYREFAAWQRAQDAGPEAAASLQWWRQHLEGAPAMLHLPLDAPRPAVPGYRGARQQIWLPPALVEAVTAIGRRRGATLYMTLMTAYAVLLHRLSGDPEVVIGTVLAGRTRPAFEPLIGFFVNTVALRVDLGGQLTFVELLAQVKRLSLEAHEHQDVPFERVVEALHPARAAGQMPIFQTIFVLQSAGVRSAAAPGLRWQPMPVYNGTSKCDLILSVEPAADGRDGLTCSLGFDTELFTTATASRLLESYRAILEGISHEAEQLVAMIPIVGDADRARLDAWGATAGAYPSGSTIDREVAAIAARWPEACAVVEPSESLTYAELETRANRLAAYLRGAGVTRGDLVGICLERSIDAVVAQLAVLKAGAGYVPLDVTYPAARVQFILEDTAVSLVIACAATAGLVAEAAARVLALDGEAEAIAASPAAAVAESAGPDDVAYVMYTSGSTGRPNGVRVPHRGVLRLAFGLDCVQWEQVSAILQMAPLAFDAATFEIWGALLHGKRLVIYPERVPTVARLAEALRRGGVDCLWLPAAFFNIVTDEDPQCLAGVAQVIVGGEALSVPHVRAAQQRLPGLRIINGYGPTECTTFTCCHVIPVLGDDHDAPIPIGRPIGNTRVQVLDARGQPVPVGVVGELFVGGDGVALGYHRRPPLTAERFVADPSGLSASTWYRTGDRVRWNPEGVLEFHGRLDGQLKVRGFRIEPGEIEAACRRHPGVRDACVVLDRRSPVDARLVAFVAGDATMGADTAELRRLLTAQLPEPMLPNEIVVLASLPLTPNGKVDRQALLAMRREPVERESAAAAPRTPAEEALTRIWRTLLGVDAVGIHDDFFALGGHSLLAVQMFSQIQTTFGQRLPFSSLMHHPTIAALASQLAPPPAAPEAPEARLSLVPLKTGGDRPPLFLLPGIGNELWTFRELLAHLDDRQPVYGVLPTASRAAASGASIPERVAAWLPEFEAMLPSGPVAVAGYCSGAVVAFEMARQLRARGRCVSLVVVFEYSLRTAPAGAAAAAGNALRWVADDLLQHTVEFNVGRARSWLRRVRARLRRALDPAAPAEDIRDQLGMWRYPADEAERLRDEARALKEYRFEPYDGALHIFRARTGALGWRQPPADLGWGAVTTGPLRVDTVAGTHDTMFKPQFARALAAQLTAALAAASARPTLEHTR